MSLPKVTVAICTWNRCRSLHQTLTSIKHMRIPTGLDWELLVVKNNCTDDTDAVLAAFAGDLPIRVVNEPRQGISFARNQAVDAAQGVYLLWTDDDVIVDAGWLEAYLAAFAAWPEAGVFGGVITPKFEGDPPEWLEGALSGGAIDGAFAIRDFSAEPVSLDLKGDLIPYGANFAVRLAEQRKFRYDTAMGLGNEEHIRGEETDVVERMLAAGIDGRWVPGARVQHLIPRSRQTVFYIRDYYVGCGRSFARRHDDRRAGAPIDTPRKLWGLAALSVAELRYRVAKLTSRPEVWCRRLKKTSFLRGKLIERGVLPPRASMTR